MIGLLVQLLVSALLLYLLQKKTLEVLGFRITGKRVRDFFIFLLIAAFFASSYFGLRYVFGNEHWVLNPDFKFSLLAEGIIWNMKSVWYEELIFRGALFYILIVRLGWKSALAISSVAFGIYHWFSYELWGQPFQMAIIFLITGLMGMVYAYSYLKTGTIYLPVAIHFGWNFTRGFLFSEGSIGKGVWVVQAQEPAVTVSYLVFFIIQWLPMIGLMAVVTYLMYRRKGMVNGER